MRARQALVIGAVLVALGGCSDGSGTGKDGATTGGSGGNPGSPAGPASAAAEYPVTGNEQAYLTVLRGIDADLVDDEKAAIANGHRVCEDLNSGQAMSQVAEGAATRFDTDAQTAQRLVVVARSNFCKA